jgi:hypothetical protein
MYDQSGEVEGVKWLSHYKGGRRFTLFVGQLEQEYDCLYEPRFGVDTTDYNEMNWIMGEMHVEAVKSGQVDNAKIEAKLAEMESERIAKREANLKKAEAVRRESEEKFEEYQKNKTKDTPDSLFYEFMSGYINYQEMIEKMMNLVKANTE